MPGVSDHRLRIERLGELRAQVDQMPSWSVGGHRMDQCGVWVGQPHRDLAEFLTHRRDFLLWTHRSPREMGPMLCSHILVREYTWGQALLVESDLLEGQSPDDMWQHVHLSLCNLLIYSTPSCWTRLSVPWHPSLPWPPLIRPGAGGWPSLICFPFPRNNDSEEMGWLAVGAEWGGPVESEMNRSYTEARGKPTLWVSLNCNP